MAVDDEQLRVWVSDSLHSLIGYSHSSITSLILNLAKLSSSLEALETQILEQGFPMSSETKAFVQKLYENIAKQTPTISERKRQYRKRNYHDETLDDKENNNSEQSRDSEAKLEKGFREKGDSDKTLKGNHKSVPNTKIDVVRLREISRQNYLNSRQEKKLRALGEELEDEDFLFEDVKLSVKEDLVMTFKRKVHDLAIDPEKQHSLAVDGYQMPEAYNREDRVTQKKRFSVVLQSHDKTVPNPKSRAANYDDREAWQQQQISRANMTFGAKNNCRKVEYGFVFEDQIKLIREAAALLHKKESGRPESECFVKSQFEKLQEDRKHLPVYEYKDALLKAVKDYQILVVVGETGSGKTTQIPQYLHEDGYTSKGKVGCTQPRRVAAMSIAARVAQEMGVELGREVGYSIRFEDCTCKKTALKYMTDGILLTEFLREPNLASYSVIIVDEAHERTLSTDILFGLLKDLARFRPDLKLIISSATLDAEKFSSYFDNAPIFKIPGRKYPVEILYTKSPEPDYLKAAIDTVLQIHTTQEEGDILLFLTGQEEIETVEEMLRQRTKGLGTKIGEMIICPIYSNLPSHLQAKIFDPTPKNARKVVLATNIAETSLTIDGIKYVIDPGFCKQKSYDPRKGMDSLTVVPISRASALQRSGRAGRTGPGKCFRLYTTWSFHHDMEESTPPEIWRTNLTYVVLLLKSHGIHDLVSFDFIDSPPVETLIKALEQLFALGALNEKGEVTKTGRRMAEFPLHPMLSKMLVSSEKYKCSEEILTIAAMLSVGSSIFYCPKDKQVHAEQARRNFHDAMAGDHIALMKVYHQWRQTNFSTQWCYENYIQVRSMKRAQDIRYQLQQLLQRADIGLSSNVNDVEAIKKAITAGYFYHTAKYWEKGEYETIKNRQTVRIHPSSGLSQYSPRWVIYHELVYTTKAYMRQD